MDVPNISSENPIPHDRSREALEFIFTNAFKSGFGTLGKSDLDLILFQAIILNSGKNVTSDLELSKYLQITQQRIRALKEKASVKFPAINRKEAISLFLEKAKKAKVDDKYIDVPINDISVKNEIEGWLDDLDIVLHSQLNPKVFRLRIDDFLDLLVAIDDELENRNKNRESDLKSKYELIIKHVKEAVKKGDKAVSEVVKPDSDFLNLTPKTLKEAIIKGGVSLGLNFIASLIPGGIFLSAPVKQLIETISEKV